MKNMIKLLVSLVLVGIIIPFISAFLCKSLDIGNEITVAIITSISTIIVAAIEILPGLIKYKENKTNKFKTEMKEIKAGGRVIAGNNINAGKMTSSSYLKKSANRKTKLENIEAKGDVIAGDNISKK